MRFSQRHGYTPVRNAVQFESMDGDLRTSLWNVTYQLLGNPRSDRQRMPDSLFAKMYADLWANFFKLPLDEFDPRYLDRLLSRLKSLFFHDLWHKVYDVLEFVANQNIFPVSVMQEFWGEINSCLEKESSGYRFVGEVISPITDQAELDEIDAALTEATGGASEQLGRALQLLSDRQSPDYRNSIKESISAVEGQVKITLEAGKGTLGELLRHLEQKAPLHPALKAGFSGLYGYTSDEGGIRHALMEDSRTVTFEEAKFMLVACSAFINYVRGVTKS